MHLLDNSDLPNNLPFSLATRMLHCSEIMHQMFPQAAQQRSTIYEISALIPLQLCQRKVVTTQG